MNQQFLGEKSLIYLTSVNGLVFPKASSPYASNSATLDSNGIEVLLLKSVEKRIYMHKYIFSLVNKNYSSALQVRIDCLTFGNI